MVPVEKRSNQLAYYHRHRERLLAENKGQKRANGLSKIGCTVVWYLAQWQFQNGLCAVCKEPESAINNSKTGVKTLAVDHDHDTGRLRSLLCQRCNMLIGFGQTRLRAGAAYLDKHAGVDDRGSGL